MKRKVLIISNPGEYGSRNYCAGVLKDVERYQAFFSQRVGGAFYSHEILTLDKPSTLQVVGKIKELENEDYSIIIFSGHGYHSTVIDDTVLELNSSSTIDVSELRKGARKRTIILDCCRVPYNDSEERYLVEKTGMRAYASAPRSVEEYRAIYNEIVERAVPGIVVQYSCDINETSGDDSRRGGVYSSRLIGSASSWFEGAERNKYISVVDSHDRAARWIERENISQHPQIEKPRIFRQGEYFPFALKL